MNVYSWLIRRELWERRAIWLVPAILGGILVLVALFGRAEFMTMPTDAPFTGVAAGRVYLAGIGAMFLAVMSLYSSLYLLDCLYDDRRDRSILFWKSLPISDTATVIGKLLVGLIGIPLVSFVAADATSLLVAFILSLRHHELAAYLWQAQAWLQIQVLWIYIIVTTAVWFLPVAGWLLLVSAWVKRAPMLWSVLPLLIVYLIETFFLRTHYLHSVLAARLGGYARAAFGSHFNPDDSASSIWQLIDMGPFFTSFEVWAGVAVGAAMIAGAIQLRMRRTEL